MGGTKTRSLCVGDVPSSRAAWPIETHAVRRVSTPRNSPVLAKSTKTVPQEQI
jgi:hypothetical protein